MDDLITGGDGLREELPVERPAESLLERERLCEQLGESPFRLGNRLVLLELREESIRPRSREIPASSLQESRDARFEQLCRVYAWGFILEKPLLVQVPACV